MTKNTLNTPRLLLRPYRTDDEADFVSLVTNREHLSRMGGGMAAERARERLALHSRFGDEQIYAWAVEDPAHHRYLGHVFVVWQAEQQVWELGYITVPAAQGQGVASEAAKAALNWAKTENKLPLIVTVDCDHIASQRVAERTGLSGPVELTDDEGPYYCYRA